MVVSAAWMKLCALLQTVQSCVLQRFAQDTKAHFTGDVYSEEPHHRTGLGEYHRKLEHADTVSHQMQF